MILPRNPLPHSDRLALSFTRGYSLLLITTACWCLSTTLPLAQAKMGLSVAVAQVVEDRKAEADRLADEAFQQYRVSQWRESLQSLDKALEIYRAIGDRPGEADTLGNIGIIYRLLGDYPTALNYYDQSLAIKRELGNRSGESDTLTNIGTVYNLLGDYPTALNYYDQSLAIKRELGDRSGESKTLGNIGTVYNLLGDYPTALDYYDQSLAIKRELGDRSGESNTLGNIGIIYEKLGDYPTALDYYDQSLAIKRELGDRSGESNTLGNVGNIYQFLGDYPTALGYYDQSLALTRELGDRPGESNTLGNIGNIYQFLGDYPTALGYYDQSLALTRELGDRSGEAITLGNVGNIYQFLGDYPTALDYYDQTLTLTRELGDRSGESTTLANIGIIHQLLGDYPTALDYYDQSLALTRGLGDRARKATTLGNIGIIHRFLGDYSTALDYYDQSLALKRELGDRSGEANTLGNIGYLLEAQEKTELAIVFFKASVNKYETLREDLRVNHEDLQSQQQTYTDSIDDNYRKLADLLLQQGRILEAQQVLDLLKVQELDEYLRGVRGPEDKLTVLRPEREILQRYGLLQESAIAIGQELAPLRKRRWEEGSLSPSDEQRLDDLVTLQEDLNNQFSQFLNSTEIQSPANQLSPENKQTLEAAQKEALFKALDDLQDDLQQLNAVLLYPLLLEDRLELIITLPDPDTTPLRRTVPLNDSADLNRAISDLRQALRNPTVDATAPAQVLYKYLIEPLESDLADVTQTLTNGEPPTILYAPDGALRYIPLAALHDGNQWLAQRFRINTITAESLTEFQSPPAESPRVLAGAFADPTVTYTVPIDGRTEDFSGLPFAGQEVENLVKSQHQTTHFMDSDFGWTQMRRLMGESNIVHFATHAAFVPGSPEESFILFGNGDRAILECLDDNIQTEDDRSCINNWNLNSIDLVVLSACETGVTGLTTPQVDENGDLLPDGKEILGLGYQFQSRGARAVMASLWKVSDGGPQALMDAFYGALQQEGISKSEALRLAQVALITGDFTALGLDERGAVAIRQRIQGTIPQQVSQKLSHPYYWAPFILIGNGL
ncbi:MAG: tetratricopeptide repeat protein [Cyanobacteria bacterium P01_F01_bin.150]